MFESYPSLQKLHLSIFWMNFKVFVRGKITVKKGIKDMRQEVNLKFSENFSSY